MEIKSILFSVKKNLKIFVVLILLTGCVQKTVRNDVRNKNQNSNVVDTNQANQNQTNTESTLPQQGFETVSETKPVTETPKTVMKGPLPKFGFIFSGGGAKAWAHVGVLKELQKYKWPVHSVAGFEWGSVVAAIYAQNLSANEVDWELGKLKEFEETKSFLNIVFEKKSTSDMKVPFVCPSLNISKQSYFLLNRGQLPDLMPFCTMHPPVTEPYSQSVAVLSDVSSLATHLRQTGANRIILVNVLGQTKGRSYVRQYESAENILWVLSAASMARKPLGVDEVIQINLDDYGITDFDKRRDIIAKGAELSYTQIQKLAQKFGL